MKFNKIKTLLILGGSRLTVDFSKEIKEKYELIVFTSPRQLDDVIYSDGMTLKTALKKNQIKYFVTKNINRSIEFIKLINKDTFALGFGEAWCFEKKVIDLFKGRLIDFMGIRLPQYRGGAHYTWQILRKNKIGCCNLQIINEEMVQAEYDSGEIIKSKEYLFPNNARIPIDYFEYAIKEEIEFLKEFFIEIENGKEFYKSRLQDNFSLFFPRLNTQNQALINWNWKTNEIEDFICAFDLPYKGASTFLNGKKIYLKNCVAEYGDGVFHPFQTGLIYKIYNDNIYIATRNGTLIIKEIYDEKGNMIINGLKNGQRFYTPQNELEKAMLFSANYNSKGIIK